MSFPTSLPITTPVVGCIHIQLCDMPLKRVLADLPLTMGILGVVAQTDNLLRPAKKKPIVQSPSVAMTDIHHWQLAQDTRMSSCGLKM
jgi:hypothetical protein